MVISLSLFSAGQHQEPLAPGKSQEVDLKILLGTIPAEWWVERPRSEDKTFGEKSELVSKLIGKSNDDGIALSEHGLKAVAARNLLNSSLGDITKGVND